MDKKLQLILHLYKEAEDPKDLGQLLEDPDVKAEYKALSDVKFWLDHARPERPDAAVLDAIRNAAAQGDTPSTPSTLTQRMDRPPAARRASKRRKFGVFASVLSLLAAVGIGYQWMRPSLQNESTNLRQESFADQALAPQAEASNEIREFKAEEEAAAAGFTLADEAANMQTPAPATASLAASSDTTVPDWDDVDDLLRYRQRIEMLLEQSEDLRWDQPVPLEMLPSGRAPNSGLLQTRSPSSSAGNQ